MGRLDCLTLVVSASGTHPGTENWEWIPSILFPISTQSRKHCLPHYIIRILGFWYIIHKRIILKHRRELRVCHKVCKSLQILYIYIYVYFKLINLTLYVFKGWWKCPSPPCWFLLYEYSIFQILSCSIYCIYLNYDLSSYSKIGFQVL